jgi:hypothetical protein
MARYVYVRALNRSASVRVTNSAGNQVKLSPTTDTLIDLDLASNRRSLGRHSAIGQYIVTQADGQNSITADGAWAPAV